MISGMKISLLVFVLIEIATRIKCSRELIQIHTLTRHGERSPCSSYPSDPYKHLWTKGLGQLTKNGILQLNEVGSYIRNQYRDLLPTDFHKDEVYIRSSDMDRTIVSALAAMKTLFEDQIVPVHTVPKSDDFLLKMSKNCPLHKVLLQEEYKSEKYAKIISHYSQFFEELEKGTGLTNLDIRKALKVCGAISVWSQLNLTLPSWVNSQSITKCVELANLKYIIAYSNKMLTKFRGAPLFNYMVDNMVNRARSFVLDKSGMKMFGLFAHCSTISGFLYHLVNYNHVKPPLASTVIVELVYDSDSAIVDDDLLSQFHVRLLFRNDTSAPPHILKMDICNDDTNLNEEYCRLDILNKNRQPYEQKDMRKECSLVQIKDNSPVFEKEEKSKKEKISKSEKEKLKYKSEL